MTKNQAITIIERLQNELKSATELPYATSIALEEIIALEILLEHFKSTTG